MIEDSGSWLSHSYRANALQGIHADVWHNGKDKTYG